VITHIVSFRWKPEMPETHVAVITDALRALVPMIPEVRSYDCGSDLGLSTQPNDDYAIVATFDDVEGWRAYDSHPEHERVRADVIRPWIAERSAVQFET
jgi:hypothetical protein